MFTNNLIYTSKTISQTILFIAISIIFNSCFSSNEGISTEIEKNMEMNIDTNQNSLDIITTKEENELFLAYFYSIPKLENNFTLNSNKGFKHFDEINSEFKPEGASIIGRLDTNNNTFPIIYSYPADIRLPIIELYSPTGEKKNEFQLFDYNFCANLEHDENFCLFRIINQTEFEILNLKENKLHNKIDTVEVKTISL